MYVVQIIPSHVIAALQQQLAAAPPNSQPQAQPPTQPQPQHSQECPAEQLPAIRAALRLARYSLARCGAVLGLMQRLASVPESFEMARATGLTLDQVGGPGWVGPGWARLGGPGQVGEVAASLCLCTSACHVCSRGM